MRMGDRKKMKVLLVKPTIGSRMGVGREVGPPLGLAYLGSMLEENGHTPQDLADAYLEARASILEELVEAGRITQERADQIMDAMESRIETALENGNWPPARPSV